MGYFSTKAKDETYSDLIYLNVLPFHAPGTRIYEGPDGEYIFDCPHCGCRRVPSHWLRGIRIRAIKPDEGKRETANAR
jgi:hypothetical protein